MKLICSYLFNPITFLILMACSYFVSPPSQAGAVRCDAVITEMNFGMADFINASSPNFSTTTVRYSCTNDSLVPQQVNACFFLGESASGQALAMYHAQEAGKAMLFEVRNANTNQLWGSVASKLPLQLLLSVPRKGEVTGNLSVRGKLLPNQKQLPPGNYRSRFDTNNVLLMWSEQPDSMPNSCMEQSNQQLLNFPVTASVQKNCNIGTRDVDFGTLVQFGNGNVDAQGEVTIECTLGTQYQVALRSVTIGSERFSYLYSVKSGRGGRDKVAYALFQNPGRTLLWADGADAKSGQGTGTKQIHPVYGRLLGGPEVHLTAGEYRDTVMVTLLF